MSRRFFFHVLQHFSDGGGVFVDLDTVSDIRKEKFTLPDTNSKLTSENWWLEDDPFRLVQFWPIFGVRTVSFSGRVTHLFRTLLNTFDILY